MKITGKAPPNKEELDELKEAGFEHAEIYLEKQHLERFEETRQVLEETKVNISSIHTPHIHVDTEKGYIQLTDQLCSSLDAYMVIHTQYMLNLHIPDLEEIKFQSGYGYENQPGSSLQHLEETVLKKGHELVLDVAHLYMAEENTADKIKHILTEYSNQVEVIHFCDSTKQKDGLALGKGNMKLGKVFEAIETSDFNGKLVLEVMPEHQEDAKEKIDELKKK